MSRSTNLDPIEKFRFSAIILGDLLDPATIVTTILGAPSIGFTALSRAGFTNITLPRQTTTAIEYRENLDATHPQQIPGLTKFESITLNRGVTKNSDFYQWATQVHDSTVVPSTSIQRIRGQVGETVPGDSKSFRKELMIVAYNRGGGIEKAWILFNAWPSSYKPGDDFNATEENKLIEELEVTYEYFQEISLDQIVTDTFNTITGIF